MKREWMRKPNLGCLWSSSSFRSTILSSHWIPKCSSLSFIRIKMVSILTPWTESSRRLRRIGSIFSWNVSLETNYVIAGMKFTIANLILQVLSFASLSTSGNTIVPISPYSSDMTSFLRFSRSDTLTSVAESFKIVITVGITYWIVSDLLKDYDNSQMAWAILPFTCWLWSLAIYSLIIGRILSTRRSVLQYLATIGTLSTASLLTSGSLSLSKSSYKLRISVSTTCLSTYWERDEAFSAMANLNLHEYLFSAAFLKTGRRVSDRILLSFTAPATYTELHTAYILTESFGSSRSLRVIGRRNSFAWVWVRKFAILGMLIAEPLLTIGVSSELSSSSFSQIISYVSVSFIF